jgi:eukaryotic-like serine/threonine-protein kinase
MSLNRQAIPEPILVEKRVKPCPVNLNLGKYRCKIHIGSGSYGNVYLAEDPETKKSFAIKQIGKRLTDVKVLQNEIKALQKIKDVCQHAICYEELLEDENNFYLVTDYVDGYEVTQVLYQINDVKSILVLMYNVVYSVYAVHQMGVAHNDLQPSNMLILPNGDVKLIDFGMACLEDCDPKGTLNFLAPEKFDRLYRRKNSSLIEAQQSDVYAIGVIFYMILNKSMPRSPVRDSQSLMSWMNALSEFNHEETKVDKTSSIESQYRAELMEIIKNCIDRDPLRRFTSKQLIDRLEKVIDEYDLMHPIEL